MCKYYTVIRFILCIIYYIYPGAVVVRKPRKEANFRLARPAAYRSITETWPSKPVMGHATQSGGINQVAGDAATATAIPNLKSVSDRSHEGRRTIATIKLSEGRPSDLRHLHVSRLHVNAIGSGLW